MSMMSTQERKRFITFCVVTGRALSSIVTVFLDLPPKWHKKPDTDGAHLWVMFYSKVLRLEGRRTLLSY